MYQSSEKTAAVVPGDGYISIRLAYAQFTGSGSNWLRQLVGDSGDKEIAVNVTYDYLGRKGGGPVAWGLVTGRDRAMQLVGEGISCLPWAPVQTNLGPPPELLLAVDIIVDDVRQGGIVDILGSLAGIVPAAQGVFGNVTSGRLQTFQTTANTLSSTLWPAKRRNLAQRKSLVPKEDGKGAYLYPHYIVIYDQNNVTKYPATDANGKTYTYAASWSNLENFARFPSANDPNSYLCWNYGPTAAGDAAARPDPTGGQGDKMEQGSYILLAIETHPAFLKDAAAVRHDSAFAGAVGLSLVQPTAEALRDVASDAAKVKSIRSSHCTRAAEWVKQNYGEILNVADREKMVTASWTMACEAAGVADPTAPAKPK